MAAKIQISFNADPFVWRDKNGFYFKISLWIMKFEITGHTYRKDIEYK